MWRVGTAKANESIRKETRFQSARSEITPLFVGIFRELSD
jgi:hypothetical protein